MVRVGGGWVALDEFLLKNDPCRGKFLLFFHLIPYAKMTIKFILIHNNSDTNKHSESNKHGAKRDYLGHG